MRSIAVIVVVVGLVWFIQHNTTSQQPPQPAAPPATAEQLLTEGRELFDAWQKPESRKTVTLDAVAGVITGLERISENDQLYTTGRQAIELLRPMRETLAVADSERRRIETDRALNEARAKQAAERKRIAEDEPGRRALAKRLEHTLLDGGRDVYINVSGPKATNLTVRYIFVSRPLIHQITQDGTFINRMRDAGFRRVTFTDGYDKSWTYDLTK